MEEPKWPPWSILPDDDVCSVCLSRPEQRGRIESCSHLFCYRCIFDWSRVETKCPMCKQRFYWIEREAKEKKKKKNDGEGNDDDDDNKNSSISDINDIKNNQREKPTYCPLKNQNGNQEEEDEDLDPAEHIICTVCQSGDDERNLLLCDGCDEGYHVSCVGLQRVPRGRWHCPSCARWEREREEREANRRRLAGATTTTTTTTTRREGSSSRAARMARAPRGDASPTARLGMLEALVNPTNEDVQGELALRENALLASAANEDPAHRENRLVRERRQANRMRNGEVRLSGGGGGSSTFNRGDSHRRRQIAIVQELRDAWERLMKEEEEFPDVDEVALITQSRRSEDRNNASNTTNDLENARSNANIDVETAWKLMDSARAEEEKEKRMKRANRKKKVALGRSAEENEQPSSSLPARNISSTDPVKRPKIRVRVSTDYTYNNNNNNALGVLQSVPSFLRDTLGDGDGANKASNATEEKEEEEHKQLPLPPVIDVYRTAADAAKALLIDQFRDKTLSKEQYKNTIKEIVKKCAEADKNMQRLQAGSITVADIERIARIDAEEVVLAAAKAKM